MMVSRRQYISLIPATALAGCIGSDEDSLPPLGGVQVMNRLSHPVTANVTIEREGQQQHSKEYQLRAFEDEDTDAANNESPLEIVIQEPWMGDPVNYEITLDVPSVGIDTYTSEEFADQFGGEQCWSVHYDIKGYGDGSEGFNRWGGMMQESIECSQSESS